jgi:hypothetical protein
MDAHKLITDNFDAAQQAELKAARKAWESVKDGRQLEPWLQMIPTLTRLRALAMRHSNSNAPIGRRYAEIMAPLLDEAFPEIRDRKYASLLSDLAWLGDNGGERLAILAELRQTDPKAAEITNPRVAKRKVEGVLKSRSPAVLEDKQKKAAARLTPAARMEELLKLKDAELAEAKQRGSVDIEFDDAATIAAAIYAAGLEKALAVVQEIERLHTAASAPLVNVTPTKTSRKSRGKAVQ